MGKLIVIEGLDGSGKSTQAPLLAEELRNQGREVMLVSYPDYKSESSALVKMYLAGEFGAKPDDVNPYAASSFYAVDRYASYVKNWREFYQKRDNIVIATRYTTSNEIHQLAKLDRDEWANFIDWAEDYEYEKLGIPRPKAVLFLDMKQEIALDLISKRAAKTGQSKDIHEIDAEYLDRCQKAANYASDRLGWKNIICYEGREPLPQEEITAKIFEEVTKILDIK